MQTQRTHERATLLKTELRCWRRQLHRYPELSFQEQQTSAYVQGILESMEVFDIQTGIAGYGIVATLGSGESPVIGLRADMDALPIQEQTGLSFQSEHAGVMHACGHDAHTAVLLGAARLLAEDDKTGNLKGTIKFIFQPAEEAADEHGLTGAPYLLQSGVLDDVEVALALHVCPWRETGEIQVNDGPSMANIDNFDLIIKGTGGHGGYPHQGTDPIWMAGHILQGIYGLISRKLNPLDVGTISIGEIHGGSAENVVPETVRISGTMRSYTNEVRKLLIQELKSVATMVHAFGGDYVLDIEHGEPALNNTKAVNDLIKQTAKELYPNMKIYQEPFGMGGEDFGHITEKIPGAMFFLGCGGNDEHQRNLHTSDFQIDEDVLPIGAALFTALAHRLVTNHHGGEET